MKKKTILFWISPLVIIIGFIWFTKYSDEILEKVKDINKVNHVNQEEYTQDRMVFDVYYKGSVLKSFDIKENAIEYGKKYGYIYIKQRDKDQWLWDNLKPFILYQNDKLVEDYDSFSDAVFFAKEKRNTEIFFLNDKNKVWSSLPNIKNSVLLDAPLILQNPELPRGCEVTSLSMLLNYAGVKVNKMELAKKVKKDTTPLAKKENRIYYGNPNNGFVGDMYTVKKPGYGVYNGPIAELMEEYMPNKTVNLTGSEFEDLLQFLSKGTPIWVVLNTTYKRLDEKDLDIWITPTGPVEITYKLHALLLTGYDEKFVYINDPLVNKKNIKIDKQDFIEAWNQMGKQAVTYIK